VFEGIVFLSWHCLLLRGAGNDGPGSATSVGGQAVCLEGKCFVFITLPVAERCL